MIAPKHRKFCYAQSLVTRYCASCEAWADRCNRAAGWTVPTHRAEVPTQTAGAA